MSFYFVVTNYIPYLCYHSIQTSASKISQTNEIQKLHLHVPLIEFKQNVFDNANIHVFCDKYKSFITMNDKLFLSMF